MDSQRLEWLVVINAESARVGDGQLTLEGLQPMGLAFTDRPVRRVRRITTEKFMAKWEDIFAGGSPNAAVSWLGEDGENTAVVELGTPTSLGKSSAVLPFQLLPPEDCIPGVVSGAAAEFVGRLTHVSVFIDKSSLSIANTS